MAIAWWHKITGWCWIAETGSWVPIRTYGFLAALLFGLACGGVPSATAQQNPPPNTPNVDNFFQPRERLSPIPDFRPPREQPRFRLPDVPLPPADAPLSEGPQFRLNGVAIDGNTVLSEAELAPAVARFLGRLVSTADLEVMRRGLTQIYIDRGYINSGALLPDQQVKNGIVRFDVIEGELNDIVVTGLNRMHPKYLEQRLRLSAGPPLNVVDLQNRIRLLLDDPFLDRIDAALGPGRRLGESELSVDITESRPYDLTVAYANRRSPSIGAEERRVDGTLRNLSGFGDTLGFGIGKTDGLLNRRLTFSIPVTPYDTVVNLRMEDSRSDVVDRTFRPLDIQSKSEDLEIGVTHPIYRVPGESFSTKLRFERRTSESELLGRPFSFTPGTPNGESTVSVLRLGFDFLQRSQDHVFAARYTHSHGLTIMDATSNPRGLPDSDFDAILAQMQYVQRVGDVSDSDIINNTTVVLRLDGQFTDDRLLPLEKFAVGGVNTVRGYRENQLVRDKGFVAALEARIPILTIPIPFLPNHLQDGRLELVPFVDYGRAWNNQSSDPDPESIYSVGAGIRWSITRHLQASVFYGEALRDVPRVADGDLQDSGVHFRIALDLGDAVTDLLPRVSEFLSAD